MLVVGNCFLSNFFRQISFRTEICFDQRFSKQNLTFISPIKEKMEFSSLCCYQKISAHADGGPRSRVRARGTLRSAPHRHQRKFSGTRVCRVDFTKFPHFPVKIGLIGGEGGFQYKLNFGDPPNPPKKADLGRTKAKMGRFSQKGLCYSFEILQGLLSNKNIRIPMKIKFRGPPQAPQKSRFWADKSRNGLFLPEGFVLQF